ncbi:ABC transporter permease [Rhodococcus oryzae]|uniref:ABC transporter permease n=1 Tax=Rhodococcus oryzae TaxID=2571143 RepID=UPI0037963A1F
MTDLQTREAATVTHSFPVVTDPPSETSWPALIEHSKLQAGRLLRGWLRDPFTILQAVIYPAVTMLMFWAVLGISITKATGVNSIFGTAPMMTLVGAMFGCIASGLSLKKEWKTGLLARFWILPMHRAAGLVSRLIAESVRIMITTVLIVLVAIPLGFRFTQGPLAAIGMLFVPLLLGLGFATLVTMLSVMAAKAPLVELLSLLCTLLMFFNSGFVPTAAYPVWLQNFVENQPMSCAIDTMKGLTLGGPVAEPLIKTALWSIGAVLVFTYPAIKGYQRAAHNPAS